jgi:hypothetical protein
MKPARTIATAAAAVLLCAWPAFTAPDVPGATDAVERAVTTLESQGEKIAGMPLIIGSLADEIRNKDKENAALRAQVKREREAKGKLPAYGVISIGGAIWLAGVAGLLFGAGRVAIRVIGIGVAATAGGFAILVYGPQFALIGLALAVAAIAYVVVDTIRTAKRKEDAGIEIADGIQQAVNAGAASFHAIKPFLEQSQGPEAKAIVNKATK